MNLRGATCALHLEPAWLYILGTDPLGRSLLARLIVAAQNTC